MTDETVELLPCPLCGDKDEFNPSVSPSYGYVEPGDPQAGTVGNPAAGLKQTGYYVECDKCGCCGPTRDSENECVGCWNTRTTTPADAELVDLRNEALDLTRRVRALVRAENSRVAEARRRKVDVMDVGSRDEADRIQSDLYAAWTAKRLDTLRAALEAIGGQHD